MSGLEFERAFWGDCLNTYDEESKHFAYARFMGLSRNGFAFCSEPAKVIDVGGGPVSMLLRTETRLAGSVVVDPLMSHFPEWVRARYACAGIVCRAGVGEHLDFEAGTFDEAWIYNVLQHTVDPERVLLEACRVARRVRLFEWVGIPAYEGHPHMLEADVLRGWLGTSGGVERDMNENGAVGRAFGGAFE